MNRQLSFWLTGLGSIACIVAFFLPWVRLEPNRIIMAGVLPVLQAFRPELAGLVSEFVGRLALNGYDIVVTYNFLPGVIRLIPLFPLVGVLLASTSLLLYALGTISATVANRVALLSSFIITILLLLNISALRYLGFGDNQLVATALTTLGFNVAIGFWVAVTGLVIMSIGAGLHLLTASRGDEFDSPESLYN